MLVGYQRGKMREAEIKVKRQKKGAEEREFKRRRGKKWQEDGVMCYCEACSGISDPSGG